MKRFCALLLMLWSAGTMAHASTSTLPAPATSAADTSRIGIDGVAHVTRVVPVPSTVSAQAQASLARMQSDEASHASVAEQRHGVDTWQAGASEAFRKRYAVALGTATIAGIPVRVVTPKVMPHDHRDYVLMNVHGGGFVVDSGSLTESIPMAALTHTKVVSVLYPLSPEHAYPAAVDAAVAVYKVLLKTYPPAHIVIYGTSAGAILTGEIAVHLKMQHLPEPAALGIFSGFGDFSRAGDSMSLFTLAGLSGHLDAPHRGEPLMPYYVGKTDPRDPGLSPLFADLRGLPPTLFITSTRDLLLSGTTILHRAFLDAGVDARLVVFEALPHTFWNDPDLPEATQAHRDMADFFTMQLYGQDQQRDGAGHGASESPSP